jgi:hypothetical protein
MKTSGNENTEKLFKHLARSYVDYEGALLKQESENTHLPAHFSTQLDLRVKKAVRKNNILPFISAMASVAAVLILVFSLQRFLSPPEFTDSAPEFEIIPLSFTLPDNLFVNKYEIDRGQSIYTLENRDGDHVVMTLEHVKDVMERHDMPTAEINNHPVYYKSTSSYNLILFEHDGLVYELSCPDKMSTIIQLSKNILQNV